MKVLYILHTTQEHGATISFKNMIEGIVRYGIKPVIVYPKNQYNDVIKCFEHVGCICKPCLICLTILPNQTKILYKYKQLAKLFLLKFISYLCLLKIAKCVQPDLIHTNTGVVREGYFVAKTLKIPHVWHIREYQTKDFNWEIIPSKNRFEKELSKSYSIFITKELQQYFGQGDKTSKVIYNPIYDYEDTVIIDSDNNDYFLVANRISKEKGIEDIIKGFALFCECNDKYKLKIAGSGDETYLTELRQLCMDLNVIGKVVFVGHVHDMRKLIYNAKVLFVGSYYEAFGRMTAEANLLGTFVIGRNTGGTKEILELTRGGFLFDKYEDIPVLLRSFLNSENYIIKESKQIALEYFSKKKHCEHIIQVYNKIKRS